MQQKILLGGGKLDELRPSFEATLRVGSKDSCFAELPIAGRSSELNLY
jgi:hypothetical protein